MLPIYIQPQIDLTPYENYFSSAKAHSYSVKQTYRQFVVSLRYEDERNGREGTRDENKKWEGNEDEQGNRREGG